MRDDHIDFACDQLRDQLGQALIVAIRPAALDNNVAPLLIAERAQPVAESLRAFPQTVCASRTEKSDPKELAAVLRACGEWPGSSAAKKCDEFPSPHGSPLGPTSQRSDVCALQQNWLFDVRWVISGIKSMEHDVRFTPKADIS